jgi:hypothetical protein
MLLEGSSHRGPLPFVMAGFSSFSEVYSGRILPDRLRSSAGLVVSDFCVPLNGQAS